MPATKRRHQVMKVDSHSPTPEPKDREDVNAVLIAACIKILARAYPQGMTSKELAAELQGVTSLPSNLSSTTLSSRLNGLFRKYHGDRHDPSPEQLNALPIRRETSKDLPKRLVYTYSKSTQQNAESPMSEAEEPATPPAEEADLPTKKRRIASPVADEEEPEEVSFTSPVSHTPSETSSFSEPSETFDEPESSSNSQEDAVPELEPEQPSRHGSDVSEVGSEVGSEPSESNGIEYTGAADPTETLETVLSRVPSFAGRPLNKINLYYDALGTEALSAVLNSGTSVSDLPRWNLDFTTEFVSPESVALEDLESFLC